jgi:hypothetical protein
MKEARQMLRIIIPGIESYNSENNEFITSDEQILDLEHSLASISKWEQKHCKPFLSKDEKTYDETIDYIKCMTITQQVSNDVYEHITNRNIIEIRNYIEASMTATTFSNDKKSINREIITSEIIYFWMISFNIPFECQYWHLNRLLTLLNVCNIKNNPPKKMSKKEVLSRNAALNAARKNSLNTKG